MSEGSVTISKTAALNTELAGTNKDNLNKILGKGNPTITNSYSLANMKISFVGGSDSYKHTHTTLDGTEKNTTAEIVSNLMLNNNIWNLSGEYPVHK